MDIHIKVKPNARENALSVENDILHVRIKATPIGGEANKALISYLSEVFSVPKSRIEIRRGSASKFKTICIPTEYEAGVRHTIERLNN